MVVVVVAFMVVVVIFEIAYVVMLPAMGHQMCYLWGGVAFQWW